MALMPISRSAALDILAGFLLVDRSFPPLLRDHPAGRTAMAEARAVERDLAAVIPGWRVQSFPRGAFQTPAGEGAWYQVEEKAIDRSDPDCVWRIRQRNKGPILEMWSPVRWVLLLIKLILPLRTHQTRMLDSGESDTERFNVSVIHGVTTGEWVKNRHILRDGTIRDPAHRGVFRRICEPGMDHHAMLYISTNKTADLSRRSVEMGYTIPWPMGGAIHSDPYYWLAKLCKWQEKYNPIDRRSSWMELTHGKHIQAKSEFQLAQ